MYAMNTQKPNNYLVWAILTTLLCCLPFGIVAIIKSTQVDTLWASGKYDEAYASADASKKWSIAAAVSSAVIAIIYAIVLSVIAISEM